MWMCPSPCHLIRKRSNEGGMHDLAAITRGRMKNQLERPLRSFPGDASKEPAPEPGSSRPLNTTKANQVPFQPARGIQH